MDHRFRSSTRSTNCSGPMRIAAPVGHARTHAGPPSMPTQASHFTAFLPFSFADGARLVVRLLRQDRCRPNSSHDNSPRLLRRVVHHADDAVRAVRLAIAAADARVVDVDLAALRAADRVRRTILHAMRLLAMAARGRDVHVRVRRTGFAIEPRHAAVRLGAGLLAVVAADAQRLVDDQHVGRFAETLAHQEVHQRAGFRAHLHARVVDHAPADVLLQRIEPRVVAARQLEEFLALDLDGIGGDGRRRGLASHRIAHQRHLADQMAGANLRRPESARRPACATARRRRSAARTASRRLRLP